MDGDATAGVLPPLDADPEAPGAVGLAADVELPEPDGLADDAHPARAAAPMSAAAATASRPDPENPGLESPFPEYPALESLARGDTAVPFMRAAPHAPFSQYDGNAGTPVAPRRYEAGSGLVWVTGAVTHLWVT